MSGKIDFTNCKVLFKAYGGANGGKLSIEYDSKQYMLKFPPSAEGKRTVLSYTNNCISEYIGSNIFRIIGMNAQETLLGTYCVNEKEKIVCACLDFTVRDKQLYDFCSVKNTIIDSDSNGRGTELSSVEEAIKEQQFVDPNILTEHFWNMFVVDALIGNFDRHNGNWGIIVNNESQTAEIAPIFDCGSCLLPQADEATMEMILSNSKEMNARIFVFPNSAIKINGNKINYFDFLTQCSNSDCRKALLRIVPNIDMTRIHDFIIKTPYLTNLQQKFYMKYLDLRMEKIIIPAYKFAIEQEKLQCEPYKESEMTESYYCYYGNEDDETEENEAEDEMEL